MAEMAGTERVAEIVRTGPWSDVYQALSGRDLSEHTVARHVQNIFAKLGVSSRTAAAAVALRKGLL